MFPFCILSSFVKNLGFCEIKFSSDIAWCPDVTPGCGFKESSVAGVSTGPSDCEVGFFGKHAPWMRLLGLVSGAHIFSWSPSWQNPGLTWAARWSLTAHFFLISSMWWWLWWWWGWNFLELLILFPFDDSFPSLTEIELSNFRCENRLCRDLELFEWGRTAGAVKFARYSESGFSISSSVPFSRRSAYSLALQSRHRHGSRVVELTVVDFVSPVLELECQQRHQPFSPHYLHRDVRCPNLGRHARRLDRTFQQDDDLEMLAH